MELTSDSFRLEARTSSDAGANLPASRLPALEATSQIWVFAVIHELMGSEVR